ncbi:hypothetical protein CRUP_015978 [Coryphaenoides rupestris]|nr:hypothetical protein CRUP_015978 [Coryphaenoides rupestris]
MKKVVFLCLLATFSGGGVSSIGGDGGALCPGPRKAFDGSCYEFVAVRRSFWAAQAWCEQAGGHLVFVHTEETQVFLRSQLDPDKDWWLGLAPPGPAGHGAEERTGSLSWLDGSTVVYSSWAGSGLQPAAAAAAARGVCSALLQGGSLFRWKATEDCDQELNFVCQYESSHVIACEGGDPELRCPSGHVIQIDGGFYGRETPHYCRRPLALSASASARDQRSFWAAQAWCEQAGGHLVFVHTEETQVFLRSQLDPDKDWWLGLAPPGPAGHGAEERTGSLSWLDGSTVVYSSWAGSGLQPAAAAAAARGVCSALLQGGSLFRWKATEDCDQELNFVCQYESSHVIACEGGDPELRCPSGHVIQIDGGFYGRETPHYCRRPLALSASASARDQCASVDVSELLEALKLSVNTHSDGSGNVSENVTMRVKWKWRPFPDHLTCLLSTGDGRVTHLQTGHRSESSVVHRYLHPGMYTVRVECSGLFPMDAFSIQTDVLIGGGHLAEHCPMLSEGVVLASSGVGVGGGNAFRPGLTAQGVAAGPQQLQAGRAHREAGPEGVPAADTNPGAGQHHPLTLEQSDVRLNAEGIHREQPGTFHPHRVHPRVEVCVLEGVAGLSAALMSEDGSCPARSADVSVVVSLRRGGPVKLVFLLTGLNGSVAQSREMLRNTEWFNLTKPFRGPLHIRLIASNRLSSAETLVGCCSCDALGSTLESMNHLLGTSTSSFWKKDARVREVRSSAGLRIAAAPGNTVMDRLTDITLSVIDGYSDSSTDNLKHWWTCGQRTLIEPQTGGMDYTVTKERLAEAFARGTSLTVVAYGVHLRCSDRSEVSSLFLPAGEKKDKVTIEATLQGSDCSTSIYAELREEMLSTMEQTMESTPSTSTEGIQGVADTLAAIVQQGDELSPAMQAGAFSGMVLPPTAVGPNRLHRMEVSRAARMVQVLGSSLLSADPGSEGDALASAAAIVATASNMLASATNANKVQSALLKDKAADSGPVYVHEGNIGLLVNRISVGSSLTDPISTPHPSSPQFTLPSIITQLIPDVGEIIIRILLPRPLAVQQGAKVILNLANQSTTVLTVPTAESTVVIKAGVGTTLSETQCFCNHLTSFGSSFFVMPNTIDMSRTAELFGSFAQNPVVVCFVGSLFLAYLLVVIWARYKDLQDTTKVTELVDNDPLDDYRYVLSVSTGHRRGASTSSQVTVTLEGSEGYSEPHHLSHGGKPVFERGRVDLFLLTTPFCLGQLRSLRLWHDNSGSDPGCIFRYTRPRRTDRTRRTTKDKAGAPGPESLQTLAPQTPSACDVTVESVVKDIHKMACSLSKTLRYDVPALQSGLETAGSGVSDIKAILSVLTAILRQHMDVHGQTGTAQIHQAKTQYLHRKLCYVERRLAVLDPSHLPDRDQALEQVRAMKERLQGQMVKVDGVTQRPDSINPEEKQKGKEGKRGCCGGGVGLPWWFVFLGWLLVAASSVVAGFFTMLYGLKFGKQMSISWLISMAVSFFESLLVIQPLKVLGLAVFFALLFKKVDEDDYENIQFHKPTNTARGLSTPEGAQPREPVCRESRLYRPPAPVDMEQMRRNHVKEQKAFALIKEILSMGRRDPNAFYLSAHIRRNFCRHTSSSMTYGQVLSWANGTLLQNLFGYYPGFITDGNSKLVGSARIRQLRVGGDACDTGRPMDRLVADCHAPYSWEGEDRGAYDPGWRERAAGDNQSDSQATPWTYQSQDQLRANNIWGKVAIYRAGGFAADLGPNLHNASRAVFVEFTVYNANVNLFCIVTLILETTATGAFEFRSDLQNLRLYHSPGGFEFFIITIKVFYFLFIFYYMFLQVN